VEFKLLTPDRLVYSGQAELVGGRTEDGSFSILSRHMPAAMELEPSTLKVENEEGVERFVVHGGFLFKERDETIRVLTREARSYEDIDLEELEEKIGELGDEISGIDRQESPGRYDETMAELERAELTADLVKDE
jgi:F-type H+-transporting ATPase subunit epsilon